MDVFTLVKIGWEYNDEYYYTHEYGEGNPVIVYRNRENAEAACLKKNIECYKQIATSKYSTIGAYFQEYDTSEIEDEKPALRKLGVVFEKWDIKLPQTATDEEWMRIIQLMGVVFYKLETLEFIE